MIISQPRGDNGQLVITVDKVRHKAVVVVRGRHVVLVVACLWCCLGLGCSNIPHDLCMLLQLCMSTRHVPCRIDLACNAMSCNAALHQHQKIA